MKYVPEPIDISDVELQEDLTGLLEQLAGNTHDNWAMLKIAEGWVYGEKRNDELKITPLLVPYEELPESEKEVDRVICLSVIKAVKKLGYDIKRKNRK